ncbi:MAG: ribbon-helix-helix protein, CopG family [Deltaproteobacteria bacterium]|nr:ribbon-helix-helix protein, CopG family [Deltaproteobacteria bacterium]
MRTNITVSLDAALLREVKVLAARRGTSISALLSGQLEMAVREDQAYESAKQRALSRLGKESDLGWQKPSSRDALHERV